MLKRYFSSSTVEYVTTSSINSLEYNEMLFCLEMVIPSPNGRRYQPPPPRALSPFGDYSQGNCYQQVAEKPRGEHLKNDVCMYVCIDANIIIIIMLYDLLLFKIKLVIIHLTMKI